MNTALASLFLALATSTAPSRTLASPQPADLNAEEASGLRLWYDKPAEANGSANPWMEYALPIGNGQLGAAIMGGVEEDDIQFNEKTLWTGTLHDFGSYWGYKSFGHVKVTDVGKARHGKDKGLAEGYTRSLHLMQGLATVSYTDPQSHTAYRRTYLASLPDQAIAVRYSATGKRKLNLLIRLTPSEGINAGATAYVTSLDTRSACASFAGSLTTLRYCARLCAQAKDGTVEATGEGLLVTDASELCLYLCAATDFDAFTPSRTTGETLPQLMARNALNCRKALSKGFDSILADHTADFASLMSRVRLELGGRSDLPTDKLVDLYALNPQGADARLLEELYFQYGRYLEVSSSRGIDAPNNLQGIWNNVPYAPWNSDIHTNINVEMNYWPAETCNLSETHLPFLNHIISNAQSPHWQWMARQQAATSAGWDVYTASNLFGGMNTWGPNYFPANAWYCSHLWQHYRFTLDTDFLARAFPTMWDAVLFWADRLTPDRGYDSSVQNSSYRGKPYRFEPDGTLVAPDEYTPEQDDHDTEDATAHAQQLVCSLFESVRKAISILPDSLTGLTPSDLQLLDSLIAHTDRGLHTEVYTADTALHPAWTNPRNGVSRGDTLLREWKYSPYDVSFDPSHRHLSHLMCLFPLCTLTPASPLFDPAVRSLRLRGDEATGWSMAWKVNLWAHALDGDHALAILRNALRHSTSYDIDQAAGGVYYNLLDSHAPFQIDGNFGACSGMAEMLLQSGTDTLRLLPALPSAWSEGSVSGLRASGNFEVSEQWNSGRLTRATISSLSGAPCPIMYKNIGHALITLQDGSPAPRTALSDDAVLLPTSAGLTYIILPQ